MKKINYCTKCLFPATKPNLSFNDDGVCIACITFESRPNIDWNVRKQQLSQILDKYRSCDGTNWDCIVPVSGGKDSTYQVLTMLEYGMTPLCVTSTTCHLSEIGRRNIENLKNLGADHIEMTPNPKVRAKLNRIGLYQVGDISWPEHVGMFTMPVRVAVKFNISLVIWGENPENEHGGPKSEVDGHVMDRAWLEEFGGMLGLRINDIVGMDGITANDMLPYTYPSAEELEKVGVKCLNLGQFIPWNGIDNYLISQAYGMETFGDAVEGSMVDYENLDNHQNGIHEYFKFLKFGYGRATDQASLLIRRGRLTRERGLDIVRKLDGKFPWTYLGKPIEEILCRVGISMEEFIKICDRFTNKRIFKCDNKGKLIKDSQGNLEKINDDN